MRPDGEGPEAANQSKPDPAATDPEEAQPGEAGSKTAVQIDVAPVCDWRSHLVIVTGRSGAGRTTAIGVLEDVGFDRVDGAPLRLIPSIASELISAGRSRIAIGVDARSRGLLRRGFRRRLIKRRIGRAGRRANHGVCSSMGSDEALRRRYTETRRRHPMALPAAPSMRGLALCRTRHYAPIKDLADLVIDTSELDA